MKEITDKLDFIKSKSFCSVKDNEKLQTERKYLQKTYLTED